MADEAHASHARLMDDTYRHMRWVYDLTRPAFLAGRARMRRDVAARAPSSILEIGCGTGRNLVLLARACPEADLTGLDISPRMLDTARRSVERARLSDRIRLEEGCATHPPAGPFDAIVFSYSLSMIPDWRDALAAAARSCASGGAIHIADFGGLSGWPVPVARQLRRNLSAFHVHPRDDLDAQLSDKLFHGFAVRGRRHFRDYARTIIISREQL